MKLQLNERDRICFFGDSITAHGFWMAEVFEYFIKNFPEKKIYMYNCGIAGSRGKQANIKNRMFCDCLNLFPKYVVVMFGMNDVEPNIHGTDDPEHKKLLAEEVMPAYPETLENIINIIKSVDATPIICSPTPFDEYTQGEKKWLGTDKDLETFSEIARKAAERHGLLFVDMRKALLDNIDKCPICEDRVHPNRYGHHLMAEAFLTAIGAKDTFDNGEPVELSEKNQSRLETELKVRDIMHVERDALGWQKEKTKPLSERRALIEERLKKFPDYTPFKVYLENVDYLDELRGELVKKTQDMYE